MKSKILTFLLVCAFSILTVTYSSAQSATLTKEVTVEQVQKMRLNEMIDLLPTKTKENVQRLLVIADKNKLEATLRESLIKHINETK